MSTKTVDPSLLILALHEAWSRDGLRRLLTSDLYQLPPKYFPLLRPLPTSVDKPCLSPSLSLLHLARSEVLE